MTEAVPVSWLRSRHGLLAGSALLDLLARLPEDLLTPLLSIVGGTLGTPTVGFVTTWLMLGVAFYTFAHLCYSHLDMLPREARGFRAIFAASTVALGVFIDRADTPETLVGGTFLVLAASSGLFLTYLARQQGWRLLDPEGETVDVIDFVAPHEDVTDEIEADLEREGWLGVLGATIHLTAVGLVVSLPIAIAAISTQALIYAYPIPDVVFLGWAVAVRVAPRTAAGPDRRRVLDLEFDFERFLVDVIENATRSMQGMFSTVFTILGVVLSAGFVFVGISISSAVADLLATGVPLFVDNPSLDVGLILWNVVGTLLLLGFAGIYGLWAWVRELRRLPYFLDAWEDRDTDHAGALVSRPPGLVVGPTTAWMFAVVYVHYADASLLQRAFAVAWPLTIGVGLWTIRRTVARSAQPIRRENAWIVSGLVLQTWGVWLATSLPDVVDAIIGQRGLGDAVALPFALTVFLVIAASIPGIERYESEHDDVRRYLLVGVLFVIGTLALAGRGVLPARFELVATVIAAVGFGFGLLLGTIRYYRL